MFQTRFGLDYQKLIEIDKKEKKGKLNNLDFGPHIQSESLFRPADLYFWNLELCWKLPKFIILGVFQLGTPNFQNIRLGIGIEKSGK